MKSISSKIRSLVTTLTMGALATIACAGPGIQYWQTLGHESQFKDLKAGESLVYVCTMCKTLSEMKVKSQENAMELCKQGASVSCPSCKMKTKVVMKRQRNDPPNKTEVVYVNEKGEECGFFVKASTKK